MNVTPTRQKIDAGTCPHGNPIGACPICAGLSGGGGGLANNKARRPGEMTYDQCYAIWQQMLKAKATAEEQKNLQKLEYLKAQENIKSFADKILDKISKINADAKVVNTQNPTILSRIQVIFTTTIFITVNIVVSVFNAVKNSTVFIFQKIADISDKLAAIIGELKLKIEKLLTQKHDFKSKLKSIFEIFTPLDIDNENKKIDEEKFLYKLKTTLASIKERFSKNHKEVIDGNSD